MTEPPAPTWERYARQIRYAPLGASGQEQLARGRALVCGCGALGTVIANLLARAGVGHLRIVDRDFVELTNLQRQVLFDEQDAAEGTPKALAAAEKLARANSQIQIEPVIADVDHRNIEALCRDVDVILDGTDNFETRFLLNDASQALGIPWVYGGCLGAEGQTMTIVPGQSACLACLLGEPPPPGSLPTCDTAGVVGPAVTVIAALQAMEGLKLLAGRAEAVSRVLTVIDLWDNHLRQVRLSAWGEAVQCPACYRKDWPWLAGQRGGQSAVLCGRNAVQLARPESGLTDLAALAQKLAPLGRTVATPFLVRFWAGEHQLTIFADGRAIVSGTDDIAAAKTLYARYVGS